MDHVFQFLRENIKAVLTASCEPAKAKLVGTMGTDPILKFMEASYAEIESAKPKPDVVMTPAQTVVQTAPVQQAVSQVKDEEMKDDSLTLTQALQKCQTVEEKREMLLRKYKQTLQTSQQLIASKTQRPHSRAYKALDLQGTGSISEDEEKIKMGEHYLSKSQKVVPKADLFKQKVTDALHNSGRYKALVIEDEMKKIDAETDIPESLRNAYFALLKAGVKSRLAADEDYKVIKGTERTTFLDKL